jgi:hypothetical protein
MDSKSLAVVIAGEHAHHVEQPRGAERDPGGDRELQKNRGSRKREVSSQEGDRE